MPECHNTLYIIILSILMRFILDIMKSTLINHPWFLLIDIAIIRHVMTGSERNLEWILTPWWSNMTGHSSILFAVRYTGHSTVNPPHNIITPNVILIIDFAEAALQSIQLPGSCQQHDWEHVQYICICRLQQVPYMKWSQRLRTDISKLEGTCCTCCFVERS